MAKSNRSLGGDRAPGAILADMPANPIPGVPERRPARRPSLLAYSWPAMLLSAPSAARTEAAFETSCPLFNSKTRGSPSPQFAAHQADLDENRAFAGPWRTLEDASAAGTPAFAGLRGIPAGRRDIREGLLSANEYRRRFLAFGEEFSEAYPVERLRHLRFALFVPFGNYSAGLPVQSCGANRHAGKVRSAYRKPGWDAGCRHA